MDLKVLDGKREIGSAAAQQAASAIRRAIVGRGQARMVAATGASQFEFLDALVRLPEIEWKQVEMFHLDEYIGIPSTHPASFCRYLQERLIARTGIAKVHLLDGLEEPTEVIRRVGAELRISPIDVAFVGIGENSHLAFNDPPADFEADDSYLIVTLDEACRRQQVGEGWFRTLEEVPRRAISMSIRQILKAKEIICIVPDARKAKAVKASVEGPVTSLAPASILQTHPRTTVYLDRESSALLSPAPPVSRSGG
jgi:glucosamine-6-phosphate deaminase